jgi:flagellar motility protein MotE (MotC chaperone)
MNDIKKRKKSQDFLEKRKKEEGMSKNTQELLEIYKKMSPENQANMLAHIRVAYSAQETTKRQYGLDKEPPKRTA